MINRNRKKYGKVICVLKRNRHVGLSRHSTKNSVPYFEFYTITDNYSREDEMLFMFILMINNTFNKIDYGGFTYLYCGIRNCYTVREKLLGENMWLLMLILELSLIKDVLKGLDRELTAPHHRQLVCYKLYVGPWA